MNMRAAGPSHGAHSAPSGGSEAVEHSETASVGAL